MTLIFAIIIQIIASIFWYEVGYQQKEKKLESSGQYSFFQNNEPALTVKKKEGYYEVKIYSKDKVVVK